MTLDSDAASKTESSVSARVQRPTLLLVSMGDADPEIILLLERGGYDVTTASGDAAAALLSHDVPPDVIAVDLQAPDMVGFDRCRRIRAAAGRCPIIILAERGVATDVVAGLGSGADDYLVKPAASEELLARLAALRRRAQWRATPAGQGATMPGGDGENDPTARSRGPRPPGTLCLWSLQ